MRPKAYRYRVAITETVIDEVGVILRAADGRLYQWIELGADPRAL